MNRIWISREASTPIREQLGAQILFGIVNRRFGPSERLPSVRDLARRLKIHPNTVSAVYKDLAAKGWVKRKAGSGVFVCSAEDPEDGIDAFLLAWIEDAQRRNFSLEQISAAFDRVRHDITKRDALHGLMVVHPDRNLAHILAAEIEQSVGFKVPHSGVEDARDLPEFDKHLLLTTTSGVAVVSKLHPDSFRVIPLKSVEEMVSGMGRPTSPILIGIVSRSETILQWASLLIPVLGIQGSDLIQRNPGRKNWQDGLAACGLVTADILAAAELPKNQRHSVLRLIPDSFLNEACKLVTVKIL